ncbi:MAG: hypothetical protein IKA84_06400 [Clostridia bacterium]|nr:hypothetical protein [Clostridia bacterium]
MLQWIILGFFAATMIWQVMRAIRKPMIKNVLTLVAIPISFVITFILHKGGLFTNLMTKLLENYEDKLTVFLSQNLSADLAQQIPDMIKGALPTVAALLAPALFVLVFNLVFLISKLLYVRWIAKYFKSRAIKHEKDELKKAIKAEKQRLAKTIRENEERNRAIIDALPEDQQKAVMEEYEPLDEDEIEDMVEKRVKEEKKRRKKQGYYKESTEHKAISVLSGAVCGFLLFAISWAPLFYWMDLISNVTDSVLDTETVDYQESNTKVVNAVKVLDKYLVQEYNDSIVVSAYKNLGIADLINRSIQKGAVIGTYENDGEELPIYANDVAKHYLSHTLRLACALLDVNYTYDDEAHGAEMDMWEILNHPVYLNSIDKIAEFIATNDKVEEFLLGMVEKGEQEEATLVDYLLGNVLGAYIKEETKEDGTVVYLVDPEVIANDLNTVSDVVVVVVKHNRLLAKVIQNDMQSLLGDNELLSDLIVAMSGLSGYRPAMEGLFTTGIGMITPYLGLPENDAAGYDLFVSQFVTALKDAEALTEAQIDEIQKLFVAAAEYTINEGKIAYVQDRIDKVTAQKAEREAAVIANNEKLAKLEKIANIDRINEIEALLSDTESTLTDEEKAALITEKDGLIATFTTEELADLALVKTSLLAYFTDEEKADLDALEDDLTYSNGTHRYMISYFTVELEGDGEIKEGETYDGLNELLETLVKERDEGGKTVNILEYIIDSLRVVEIIKDEGLHLKDEADELKAKGEDFENQGNALKTDIENTKVEIETVIAEIAQLEVEYQLGNKTQDEYLEELAELTQKRNELDDDIDDLTERSQKLIQDGKNLFAQGEVMAQKASDLAENATDCLEEAETRLEEFTPFMTYFMSWNSIQKPLLSAGEDKTSACMSIRINGKLYVCNTDAITIEDIIDLVANGMGDMSFGDITNVDDLEEDEIPDLEIDDVLDEIPLRELFEMITIVEIDETNKDDYDGRVSPYTDFVNYLIATASYHKETEGATEIDDAWFFDTLSRYNTVLSESESYIADNSVELINAILNAKESKEYDYKGLTAENVNESLNFNAWDDANIKAEDTKKLAGIIFELVDFIGNMSGMTEAAELADESESGDATDGGDSLSGLLGGGDFSAILDILEELGALLDGMAETECLANLPDTLIRALLGNEKLSLIMTSTMLYGEDGFLTKLDAIKSGEGYEYEREVEDELGNVTVETVAVNSYEGFMTEFLAKINGLLDKLNTKNEDTTPDDSTPDDSTPDDSIPDDTTPDDSTPDDTIPDDTTPDDTTPDDEANEGGNEDA